jgi:hypothetical protein
MATLHSGILLYLSPFVSPQDQSGANLFEFGADGDKFSARVVPFRWSHIGRRQDTVD